MEKDLSYIPETTSAECYACKSIFKLYTIQKIGLDFCKLCGVNNKLVKLTTISNILFKISDFAEKENEKIENRLVVDISKLFIELQKENNE